MVLLGKSVLWKGGRNNERKIMHLLLFKNCFIRQLLSLIIHKVMFDTKSLIRLANKLNKISYCKNDTFKFGSEYFAVFHILK